MPKQINKFKYFTFATLKSLLIALVLTVAFAFVVGFRAFLVIGWSDQPYIQINSFIVTYKCKEEDLKIGDYLCFSHSGSSYVTHELVAIEETVVDGKTIKVYVTNGRQLGIYQNTVEKVTYEKVDGYSTLIGRVAYNWYEFGKLILYVKNNPMVIITTIIGIVLVSFFKNGEENQYN